MERDIISFVRINFGEGIEREGKLVNLINNKISTNVEKPPRKMLFFFLSLKTKETSPIIPPLPYPSLPCPVLSLPPKLLSKQSLNQKNSSFQVFLEPLYFTPTISLYHNAVKKLLDLRAITTSEIC